MFYILYTIPIFISQKDVFKIDERTFKANTPEEVEEELLFTREDKPSKVVKPDEPDTTPKFMDPLPIPSVASPRGLRWGSPYYEMVMRPSMHPFHRYFPPTTIWGYNGTYPGPTFDVNKDETIYVRWINNLPCVDFEIPLIIQDKTFKLMALFSTLTLHPSRYL